MPHKVRRRDAASLDVAIDAQTAQLALGRTFRAPRLEAREIRDLFQLVHGGMIIAGVIFHRHGRGIGELGDEILAPQRDGINAQFPRRLVDHALQLIGRLGTARAAIGIDRHGIREHRLDVHIDQRRAVIPRHQRAMQPCRHRRRKGAEIGPHIGVGICADGGKVVLRIQRQLDLGHVIAPMGIGHEGLGPRTGPFHRTIERLGGKSAKRLFRVVKDFRAKAATHIGGHHAQFMLRDAQNKRAHQETDHMRVLARCIERRVAGRAVEIAHCHARLHRIGHQPVVDQLERGDMRRLGKGLVHRAFILFDKAPVITEVVLQLVMHQGGALFEGFLHVHDRWQFLDIELDRLGRIARLRIGLGHHGGNRIPHMTHLALCQHRMSRLLHHLAKPVGDLPAAGQAAHTFEILAGKNPQDPRHGLGCAGIHLVQPPVRHIRTQEMHIGLPAQIDVIGVIAVSGQKPDILAPLGAGANASVFRHVVLLPDRTGSAPMITLSALTVPELLRGSAAGAGAAPPVFRLFRRDTAHVLTAGGQDRLDDVVIARAAAEIAL